MKLGKIYSLSSHGNSSQNEAEKRQGQLEGRKYVTQATQENAEANGESKFDFEALPVEIQTVVAQYLPRKDRGSLAQCSHLQSRIARKLFSAELNSGALSLSKAIGKRSAELNDILELFHAWSDEELRQLRLLDLSSMKLTPDKVQELERFIKKLHPNCTVILNIPQPSDIVELKVFQDLISGRKWGLDTNGPDGTAALSLLSDADKQKLFQLTLTGIDEDPFGETRGYENLEELRIEYAGVREIHLGQLLSLKKLKMMNNVNLRSLHLPSQAPSLEEIYISGTPRTRNELTLPKSAPKLRKVDLNYMNFDHLNLPSDATPLFSLNIDYSSIKEIAWPASLNDLEYLSLYSCNNLVAKSIKHLQTLEPPRAVFVDTRCCTPAIKAAADKAFPYLRKNPWGIMLPPKKDD